MISFRGVLQNETQIFANWSQIFVQHLHLIFGKSDPSLAFKACFPHCLIYVHWFQINTRLTRFKSRISTAGRSGGYRSTQLKSLFIYCHLPGGGLLVRAWHTQRLLKVWISNSNLQSADRFSLTILLIIIITVFSHR